MTYKMAYDIVSHEDSARTALRIVELYETTGRIDTENMRLREALNHALKGDIDPEDRAVIAQIVAGETQEGEGDEQ